MINKIRKAYRHPSFSALMVIRPWQRHSLVLLVAGLVYIGIGVSYILAKPTSTREQALALAFLLMPAKAWGVVWILCGILAIISSRWPPASETWGYTVLTGLSAGWAAFYAVGLVFWHSPLTNLSAVMSWGLIAFMWWAISGLLNPPSKAEVLATKAKILADRQVGD